MDYYAERPTTTLTYAPWPRRVLSGVIDAFALSFLLSIFFARADSRFVDAFEKGKVIASGDVRTLMLGSLVVAVVYFTAFHSWRGATPGKMAARTVLVQDTGEPVTTQIAFVRAVAFVGIEFISGFLFFLPIILNELRPIWDPKRQTFHDRLAHTVVVLRKTQ